MSVKRKDKAAVSLLCRPSFCLSKSDSRHIYWLPKFVYLITFSLFIRRLAGLKIISDASYAASILFQVLHSCSTATPHRVTTGILKVLSEIDLPIDEAAEMRNKVLKRIGNVPLETISVLLTFVFERLGKDEYIQSIRKVRLNFDRVFSRSSCLDGTPETEESIKYLGVCSYYEKMRHNDCLSLAFQSLRAALSSYDLAHTWLTGIHTFFIV